MSTTQLTPAQHAVLTHAIHHTDGRISWFPDNIKGGARKKVIDGLFSRSLIAADGADWLVAAEGYDALGMARPTAPTTADSADSDMEAAVEAAETSLGIKAPRRTRENSKQALVIAMLRRPEGATIAQICEATGWQAHTVRGTFAGALKKLGLTVLSEKIEGRGRVYRIVE
ncbi:Protein of uncharacterised function (DUF3489) [Burkholderia pseudomallei]|uniref:DUF3489 domain-containing protein n=1 Tax=Burkholderia pseudomallei TaxID=28450 RepID=UPI0009786A9D|nr:DUF3489 domain-containing protein [Burkholderia pseudomallei]OMS46603.1 hypothetical protein AQ740_18055 [Burkholderia pseudomallei]CAJ3063570.1 Protein of uncharacterised function (DUF3489) [Burkholderia pseudomallei]CAJ3071550.1 Protein of uncharacterised function (DUF3489) [Burkholderia pseudomallei]CAJ3706037.1 Protein of uncharacterised function (DUF3489) [Burkholderia pseudomallei]CAJ3727604.1 Protein of uncharacterised function (DUF3489) [Burkholderia pseudomallei]